MLPRDVLDDLARLVLVPANAVSLALPAQLGGHLGAELVHWDSLIRTGCRLRSDLHLRLMVE